MTPRNDFVEQHSNANGCAMQRLKDQMHSTEMGEGVIHRRLKCKQAQALKYCPQFTPEPRPFAVRPIIARILRNVGVLGHKATQKDFAFPLPELKFRIRQVATSPQSELKLCSHS